MDISSMLRHPADDGLSSTSSLSSSPNQQRIPSFPTTISHILPQPREMALMSSTALSYVPPPQHQQHQQLQSLQSLQPLQPLQQHQHQHQSQRQPLPLRRGSSTSSSQSTTSTQRHRGKQTKAACIACRKRKSKCDGLRPSCKTCASKSTPCSYSVHPGITQQQAIKDQLAMYKAVLTLLRDGNVAECEGLLGHLKAHSSLQEAVGLIHQSRLPTAAKGTAVEQEA